MKIYNNIYEFDTKKNNGACVSELQEITSFEEKTSEAEENITKDKENTVSQNVSEKGKA